MALIPQMQELQQEVAEVQQMRRALHDAYIVESSSGRHSFTSGKKPPSAMEVHRTVDAPTLNVLKAPNYPFTLCEEAPPSYVLPPVPYDMEGEIDSLKQRVLVVQEDFQIFQKQNSRDGAPLSRSQVLDFFSDNTTYAEMAWEVSSLQWFYRWVLSHSISNLWNCKEQLEYVLTENGQQLPQTAEEMDQCLRELPFTDAVSLLDMDRQCVVAHERRRLRSISRTFRGRLPAEAVTMATSCYLTPEEKYMYQEFFNQSEHMLLLLNHTLMLNKANSVLIQGGGSGGYPGTQNNTAAGLLSNGGLGDSGAVMVRTDAAIGVMDTAGLAEETLHALSAEREVIATLMKTIRERQQRDEYFVVSESEYQQSRKAQIAVYGCLLSDMSLMEQQMSLVAEFVGHYEDWLKLCGFQTHEELMNELSKRSGGTAWPTLGTQVEKGEEDINDHFVPPTEEMFARYPRAANTTRKKPNKNGGARQDAPPQMDSVREQRLAPTGEGFLSKAASKGKQMRDVPTAAAAAPTSNTATAPVSSTASVPSAASKADKKPTSTGGSVTQPSLSNTAAPPRTTPGSAVANAFYSILEETAAVVLPNDADMARVWLIAAVRFTVIKILRREWNINNAAMAIAQAEEHLLVLMRRNGAYSRLTATAAALCVVTQEVARLCAAHCEKRSLTVEVLVVTHVPDNTDDYAQAVADVTSPVEQERWGCVLDALWFQADPSNQSSGGLLLQPANITGGTASTPMRASKNSVVHFLYIEAIDAPATPPPQGCVATITLRYRLPHMSPLVISSRRVAPTLAAVAGAQTSFNCGISRYQLARCALAAFSEMEVKGLLPCFACRVSEAATVPLSQVMFATFDDTNTSAMVNKSHVPLFCVLPPAAVELKRLHADIGEAVAPGSANDAYAEPTNFSTIGLLIGAVLEDLAIRAPVLNDLYMTASTVREQALWEIQNDSPSTPFANATTHPIPVSCAPTKARSISIQREPTANRNSTAVRRFVSPLLRHLDDKIASIEFSGNSSVGSRSNNNSVTPEGSVLTPRGPLPQFATGRQTQLLTGNDTTSPSPSAVQPNRH